MEFLISKASTSPLSITRRPAGVAAGQQDPEPTNAVSCLQRTRGSSTCVFRMKGGRENWNPMEGYNATGTVKNPYSVGDDQLKEIPGGKIVF